MPKSFRDFEVSDTLLGKGGMASVWLGRQVSLDARRAIKILHPAFADDQDFITRFEREARDGAALSHHPNIVTIFAYGAEEGRYFIAMEFVDGTDLRTVLEAHHPLPPEIALLLLEEVSKGLEAAHRLDIWHRDIKPSNVLLSRNGGVKVGDFGLARNNRDRERLTQRDRTLPGTIMGTLAYMSPEQHAGWDDTRIDHRTDMFSLGVMAYELLTGIRPFQGTESEVKEQAMTRDPPPLLEACPLATPAIESMVGRLMAKRREDRYASVREVLEAIREGMKSLDPDEDILKYRQEYLREFAENPKGFIKTLRERNVEKGLGRGLRLLQEGRVEEATRVLGHVLLLDPGNTQAKQALREAGKDAVAASVIERTMRTIQVGEASRGPGLSRGFAAFLGWWKRRPLVKGLVLVVPLLVLGGYLARDRLNPGGSAPAATIDPGGSGSSGASVPDTLVSGLPDLQGDGTTGSGGEGAVPPADSTRAERGPALDGSAGNETTRDDGVRTTPDSPAGGQPGTRIPEPKDEAAARKKEMPVAGPPGTITIEIHPAVDVYVDGKLERENVEGRLSLLVASGTSHRLELRNRSSGAVKTYPDLFVESLGNRDLGVFAFDDEP